LKILLDRIWLRDGTPILGKPSVKGNVVLDSGLSIEFEEELLPEELERIRDGLGDLTQRIKERVLSAIRAAGENPGA